MIDSLRGAPMMEGVRGEPPVARGQIEPISVVLLPGPDDIVEEEARIAWEFGILKIGFRF